MPITHAFNNPGAKIYNVTKSYFAILRAHTLLLHHRFCGDWSQRDCHECSIHMDCDHCSDMLLLIYVFQEENKYIAFQLGCVVRRK